MSVQSEIDRINAAVIAQADLIAQIQAGLGNIGGGGDLGVFEAIDSGTITIASISNVTVDHNLGAVPDVVFLILKDTWSASGSYSTGPRIIAMTMYQKRHYAHSSSDSTTYSLYTGARHTRYVNSSEVASTATGTFSNSTLSTYLTETTFVIYNSSTYNKSAAADFVWFCGKFKEEHTPL